MTARWLNPHNYLSPNNSRFSFCRVKSDGKGTFSSESGREDMKAYMLNIGGKKALALNSSDRNLYFFCYCPICKASAPLLYGIPFELDGKTYKIFPENTLINCDCSQKSDDKQKRYLMLNQDTSLDFFKKDEDQSLIRAIPGNLFYQEFNSKLENNSDINRPEPSSNDVQEYEEEELDLESSISFFIVPKKCTRQDLIRMIFTKNSCSTFIESFEIHNIWKTYHAGEIVLLVDDVKFFSGDLLEPEFFKILHRAYAIQLAIRHIINGTKLTEVEKNEIDKNSEQMLNHHLEYLSEEELATLSEADKSMMKNTLKIMNNRHLEEVKEYENSWPEAIDRLKRSTTDEENDFLLTHYETIAKLTDYGGSFIGLTATAGKDYLDTINNSLAKIHDIQIQYAKDALKYKGEELQKIKNGYFEKRNFELNKLNELLKAPYSKQLFKFQHNLSMKKTLKLSSKSSIYSWKYLGKEKGIPGYYDFLEQSSKIAKVLKTGSFFSIGAIVTNKINNIYTACKTGTTSECVKTFFTETFSLITNLKSGILGGVAGKMAGKIICVGVGVATGGAGALVCSLGTTIAGGYIGAEVGDRFGQYAGEVIYSALLEYNNIHQRWIDNHGVYHGIRY